MQLYKNLDILPEDPILGIPILFKADQSPNKINLGIGAYQDEHGKPVVFDAVRQADELLLQQQLDKEYLPINGDAGFAGQAFRLVFGQDAPYLRENRCAAFQTLGGTGALRVAAELLKRCGVERACFSNPTWPNHPNIFKSAGIVTLEYPFFDLPSHSINFEGLYNALDQTPSHTAVVFHSSCHNPTGARLSEEQWRKLSALTKSRQLQPIFDLAYQGLGRGLDEDAFPIRLFAKEQTPIVCVSFAKNFGLYGDRIGLLAIIFADQEPLKAVSSHLKSIIRCNYSSPPYNGARIIRTILSSPPLESLWINQLNEIRQRLVTHRRQLADALSTLTPSKDYSFYTKEEGFFSLTGLNREQSLWLREHHAIYLPENGRINIAGLSKDNIPVVAKALTEAERQ